MSTASDAAGDASTGNALHVAASPRQRRHSSSAASLTALPATESCDDNCTNTTVTTTTPPATATVTMPAANSSRKTLPPFVDSDETVHFFNDDMVLRTNAIRIVDEIGAGEQRDATSARRRGGGTRTTDDGGRDDDDDDDEEESYSDEYYDDDEYNDEDEEEYDDSDKPRGSSESDSGGGGDDDERGSPSSRAAMKARKNAKHLRVRPSEWSSALPKRNSLRSERIPDLAPDYDDVFGSFDDLYTAPATNSLTLSSADESTQQRAWDHKHRKRALSAQSAVAAFVRRAHAAKSYRSRKRCEFLRVCYQRALETEPLLDDAPDTSGASDASADHKSAAQPDSSNAAPPSSAVLVASRKDDLVETTVPVLHPRKWPHLPFRAPLQWRGNVSDALEFLAKLAALPDTSLQYEPVDVAAFVRDVLALLRAVGVDPTSDAMREPSASNNSSNNSSLEHAAVLPEDAVTGLAALLGLGVQLQSFSLLSFAALQLVVLGRNTRLDDARAVHSGVKDLLDAYWRRVVAQSAKPAFAATYSRALLAQWKISAYQPSSSDAIATDGLFLYVFGRVGLFKIGTGNGDTVRDFVYAHNASYMRSRDAERSWLCCIGTHLYCRTIMMPSNRVDRIATDALDAVEELYFSPNRSVTVKGVSESSVYAMLTDGVHLYTIRCVDTLKHAAAQAKPSDRKTKPSAPKAATRDPLVDRIFKSTASKSTSSDATATAAAAAVRASPSEATIKVGDRVVRGPDWKWGSQDGTEGSVGTVERVSTWGGIAGSGVTVRWDKTQRVNTYRWGAEGCYDLVIVVDKDGHVLERKALPTQQIEKDASVPSKSVEMPLPRHQFVLFQHDVSCVIATMDLDEDDLDVFLDLGSLDAADTSASAKTSATIGDSALISALHSHPLSLCDWKSSWMCDGGLASCTGNNAAKRYRCDAGCDFDLCETCLRATLLAKDAKAPASDSAATDAASHETLDAAVSAETSESSSASEAKTSEQSGGAATQAVASSTDVVVAQPLESSLSINESSASLDESSSPTNLESNPFAILHASLFYDDASSSDKPSPTQSEPAETASDGAVAAESLPAESVEESTATATAATATAPTTTAPTAPPTVATAPTAPTATTAPTTTTATTSTPTESETSTATVSDEKNTAPAATAALDAKHSATTTSSAVADAVEKDPREREQELVDELYAFWGGLYTHKECLVALRRNGFSLNDASLWIGACAGDLRKKLLVPTVSAVTLTAKPATGALDPVLLVAGSFYMSSGQLCVVAPPGLYSAGEHQSERMKRAVTSYDAAWFFSTATGHMLSTDETDALPVLLRGIPAGSPTCVDSASGHILVYSGYLNCLEVYVDPAQSVAQSLVDCEPLSDDATLSELGEKLFAQLHLFMLERWSSPAYKHPRAGLQELLLRTEREPSPASGKSSSKPVSAGTSASSSAAAGAGVTGAGTAGNSESTHSVWQKSKARRLKNIRGRIEMLDAIGRRDPPGYFIPFCIDFEDDGVLHLFSALVVSSERLASDATHWQFVNDVLSLLRELAGEIDFAGVSIAGAPDDAAAKQLYQRTEATLTDLARGKRGEVVGDNDLVGSLRARAIENAQAVLAWGIRRGVFCRDTKASVLIEVGDRLVAAFEREPSALLGTSLSDSGAQLSRQSMQFESVRTCEYALLHALLVCPADAGRVDIAEFVPLDFDEFARLLATLFRLAALEFRSAALQRSSSSQPRQQQPPLGVTCVSAVTKALQSLLNYCSVRLYSEKDDVVESKSKMKDSAARVTPAELFNAFALACVRSSAELLEQYGEAQQPLADTSSPHAVELSDLQASTLGTILPIVLATVSNYPACVSTKLRCSLIDLLKTFDRIVVGRATTSATAAVAGNRPAATDDNDVCSYEAHFEGDQVVESAHPYSQTQSSFRRVVRVPGARVLHIDFDPRNCTSSEADFVFITTGRAWFNSDRMAFADGGIGDNGGCFFGAYAQGNWPTQGLTIVGDTATIMLCATSQVRDTTAVNEKQRWGLRCTVRGLVAPQSLPTWLSDVSAAVANACSVIAEQLMQSVAVQPVEVQCRKWLACRELFRPIERTSVLALRKVVESRKDVLALLRGLARLHVSPTTSMSAKWSDALSFAAAALLAQSDRAVLTSLAQSLAAGAAATSNSLVVADSVRSDVQAIATELQRVEQWMIRHVQLLNEWRYLEEDAVSLDDMKERYADNADQLRELCELQNVAFHSSDIGGCIARLHAQLVASDAKVRENAQPTSAYHVIAGEVMEKAQLLLSRYTREKQQQISSGDRVEPLAATVDHPASRKLSVDRERQRVATAGDFLRSAVLASAVSECAQIQSKRLKDRIAGFALAESVLTGISSTELASWVVSCGVVALSSDAGGEIDYLSGCALGDASLLLEFEALLRRRHAFSARLALDPSKSLLLRAMAVADAFCSARPDDSVDSDSSTVDDERTSGGLAGTSALIRSVDDALVTAATRNDSILQQTSNAMWIVHRLVQERRLHRVQCDSSSSPNKRVAAATCSLFAYYERVMESEAPTTIASKRACRMLARILCMVLPSLGAVVEVKHEAVWWLEKALRLLVRAETPVSVSVCAARFCRKVISACGDRIFDAKVELRGLESASSSVITLGRDLPSVLIERVGKLMSLLPTTTTTTSTTGGTAASASDDDSDSGEQFCVVIFLNDETASKIGVAIEKVAEPDISRWNMQLEAPAATAKIQIAEPETASASMIHRSVRCDGCDMSPLRGYRFKCFTCPNYDLCTECYTGEKHNVDHEFIRLSDSSSGMGDVLQPRSKGGGTVPETSLVGSKHWKGSIVKVEVTTKGYALYRLGTAAECLETAKALAEIGCLATVVRHTELCEIDRVFGWERQLAAAVEPGSARAGRRSTSAQKSALPKPDRATISAMNAAICTQRSTSTAQTRRMDDVLALASEVIATVRSVLRDDNAMRQWRNSTFQALGSALDNASELLEMPSLEGNECRRRYWEAIGVANVLGGFAEPMRVGGTVARVSSNNSKTEATTTSFGIVQSYAFGNSVVQVCVAPPLDAWSNSGDRTHASVVECSVSDVRAVAEVPVSVDVIKTLEHLAPSFCAVIKRLHGWLLTNKTGDSSHECLYRSELGCAFMRSFAYMAPHWPSLFDNQIISTHGNIPALLFHLAQLCLKDVGLGSVEREREIVWQMEWICAQQLQFALATRPIKRQSFSAVENADCIFCPPPPPVADSANSAESSSASASEPSSSEHYYNLYAYSSRSDIPQHSGRNKLLEYWEKNVIPAIESYVSGSFKSYEMDYFFAQLREPLREGNSAAALKIAYTLCDGHVPSGCVYPDRDTDWSALQIDEVEVGGRYLISTETLDSSGWPREMLWTVGHSGVVRLVNPQGMILLDVANPATSEMEFWWYHVDSLKPCGAHVRSFADQSVVDFATCGTRLLQMNKQLVCSIARRSVFELLQVAPDHVMQLSIDRKSRRSESQFGNHYSLGELLRLAATADLECPDKVTALDASYTESSSGDSSSSDISVSGSRAPFVAAASGATSAKHVHISMLQPILSKRFDRAPSDRVALPRAPDEVLPLISKKQTKPVKVAGSSSASLKASSSPPALSSSSTLLSSSSPMVSQPKLASQPDAEPPASPAKYRFMLMESLLRELKKCMASSAAFLQRSSFTVASESPPKPVALVHVPGATCLILSFVVHPVLMDLPPGSSLEFFRDEKCSDRIFGYFGEKKGLTDLAPLVVSGDRCYAKMSQGQYARYKFRVDALTADFGLALWIGEELYQKLVVTAFTGYEVETLLAALMAQLVEYLATATRLPCSAKIPVFQLVAKLVNFALGRGLLGTVPIAKLAGPLVKELTAVFGHERTAQSGRFSLYTQQLAELLSLLEELAHLKGGATVPLVSGAWWTEFVRMAAFTRVLVHGKQREASSPEAFSRIYCGRAPIREIELAHRAVSRRDLFTERLLIVQKLPRTTRVDALRAALARLVLHLSLEECGEADDQSVYSAAEVTRFGIFSHVLHLPVDADGVTKGYAIIDVGREDIIANLLVRVPKEKLEFEGERSVEDTALLARIAALGAKANGASNSSCGNSSDASREDVDANQDEQVWSCSVCTLENSIAESECAACGSPIPPELASINRDLTSQQSTEDASPVASADDSSAAAAESGWACAACTFVNSWDDSICATCACERGADQVPPLVSPESAFGSSSSDPTDQATGAADASGTSAGSNVFHELSAVRFSDALQVAEAAIAADAAGGGTDDSDDAADVPQVTDFLRHVFVRTESDGSGHLVDAFVSVLRAEALQAATSSSTESKRAIEALTSLLELKCSCDDVGADAFVAQAATRALDAVRTQPLDVFQWLRRAGYDLAFAQSHYLSVDAALQAQAKWTFQMDCQLLAVCRSVSASIGVLMLSELCPSHLVAHAPALEHQHLLAHLETRDLRLRFAVLQSLNRLLLHALPLVNLRPWSDPNALRSRIVAIRQLVFPGVKIRFFAQTADNTSLGGGSASAAVSSSAKRPTVTLDRRKIFGRRTLDAPLSLADPKRSLFASTRLQLSAVSPSQLRAKRPTGASDPFVAFIVLFAGENVVGEGGPYRQLFHDIANELLASGSALFIPTANNATKIGEFRERYLPKPSSTSKDQLRMFEFVGVLMGCSLRTGVRLNVRLAPIVWKMLVKQSLAFTDLESVDYSLCESLKYLETEAADASRSASDVLYESFTSTLSDGTVVELKANGRHLPVTKANCKEYIRLVKASRLQECKPQVDAMLRGISKIVPVQLLQLCVWTELQQWICGSLDINVELLKRHTRYASGMSPDNFPHLEMFWRVLASFSEENKRRFINFAWGQDTLPADDAEFDRTHTRLLIKVPPVTDTNQDELLPKADTCFFNIELPAYSSEDVMREKLLLAITLCTSLDGDDETGHLDIYYAGDDGDE